MNINETQTKIPLTCILCARMVFDCGDKGYSEFTPGSGWSSRCELGRWEMCGCDVSQEQYVRNLLSADHCDSFEAASLSPGGVS